MLLSPLQLEIRSPQNPTPHACKYPYKPLSPYKDPQKCDIVLGDTPEELGSGLHLGLNLIIYVLKQATNHWIPSQGSRDMENIP